MKRKRPEWISEKQAAEMLNYQPRTLRKYVKGGKLEIPFTSLFGRKFLYDKNAIEKILIDASNLPN